jgi:hypothetical protein
MMDDNEMLLAYLKNEGMDATADYMRRGRHLANVDIGELNAQWIASFKDWVANLGQGQEYDQRPREDIESEMQVRGLQPPYESVAEESAVIKAALKTHGDDLMRDPVRSMQTERELRADLEAFQQSIKDAGTN